MAEPHLAATITGSLADVAVNVLATDDAPADRAASPRIRHIGFVPLARLMPDVNLVVSAGGTALCSAPSRPQCRWSSRRAWPTPRSTRRGRSAWAPRHHRSAAAAGAAAREVLTTPGYRRAARRVMHEIGALPAAADVLAQLLGAPQRRQHQTRRPRRRRWRRDGVGDREQGRLWQHGGEPRRTERRTAGDGRDPPTASAATPHPVRGHRRGRPPATRAHWTRRPAQPVQVVNAGVIAGEPRPQLPRTNRDTADRATARAEACRGRVARLSSRGWAW